MDAVIAKMQCHNTERMSWGGVQKDQVKVNMGVVYGTEAENKVFSDATPSGSASLTIQGDKPAAAFFKPGKKYYVTFTEAPD